MLFLTGAVDDRVSAAGVTESVVALKASGLDATVEVVPGADHFLLFSHRVMVEERLVEWFGPPAGVE